MKMSKQNLDQIRYSFVTDNLRQLFQSIDSVVQIARFYDGLHLHALKTSEVLHQKPRNGFRIR